MMNNTIVYLIGYGGTGKYTIAKELARLSDAVIVDNQLVNQPVFSVLGADGKTRLPDSIWPKIESIRRIVLDTIAELAQPQASFLFTNELYEGKPRDSRWYEDVALLATKRQALFVPVHLHCEPEEHDRRLTSPERAVRRSETSTETTSENRRTYELLRIDHPNRSPSWIPLSSHPFRQRKQFSRMWKRGRVLEDGWHIRLTMRAPEPGIGTNSSQFLVRVSTHILRRERAGGSPAHVETPDLLTHLAS